MRMRTRNGDAVLLARKDVRRGGATTDDGSARGPKTAHALSTAKPELSHGRLGRLADARSLGGNERFEVHAVQKRCFDKLTLKDAAFHAHKRLVGEHDGSLANGIDVDRQFEIGQVIKESLLEKLAATRSGKARKVLDVLFAERASLHELGQLIHAAGNRIAALERVVAEIHMEARLGVGHAVFPVTLRHGDLVQIGEQCVIDGHKISSLSVAVSRRCLFHQAIPASRLMAIRLCPNTWGRLHRQAKSRPRACLCG